MGVIEFLKRRIRENQQAQQQGIMYEVPDDVTTDRYLKSLRRQRRMQMEELEKAALKKQIAEYDRARNSDNMFGSHKTNLLKSKLERARRIKKKQQLMGRYKLRQGGGGI